MFRFKKANVMTYSLNTLIVNEQPFNLDVYTHACRTYESLNPSAAKFNVITAENSSEVIELIVANDLHQEIDIAFIELNMAAADENLYNDGLNLGHFLKDLYKDIKLIVFSNHYNESLFTKVLNELDPEAFLYHKDITEHSFNQLLDSLLLDTPFYSKSILQLIRKNMSKRKELDTTTKFDLNQLVKGQPIKITKQPNNQSFLEKSDEQRLYEEDQSFQDKFNHLINSLIKPR